MKKINTLLLYRHIEINKTIKIAKLQKNKIV